MHVDVNKTKEEQELEDKYAEEYWEQVRLDRYYYLLYADAYMGRLDRPGGRSPKFQIGGRKNPKIRNRGQEIFEIFWREIQIFEKNSPKIVYLSKK